MKRVKNYINGEWVDSEAKEYGDVWCPATGEKIGEVPFSTAADVDRAVKAAKEAYWEWRCTPPLFACECSAVPLLILPKRSRFKLQLGNHPERGVQHLRLG